VGAVLDALAGGLSAAPALALAAALGWGVASVLLSPCHLAGIPLIVGFLVSSEKAPGTGRAALLSLTFGVGVLVTIGLIGAITAALGGVVGEVGAAATYAVAAVFLVMGLELLGVIQLPELRLRRAARTGGGAWSALLLGLAFGVALGPCTFAFLAPVLAAGFATATASPMLGVSLVLAFGVGHSAVIAGAGSSAGLVQRVLDFDARSRVLLVLRRVAGVLVLVGGVYLIYSA
jgi:cytochrome c-type biogenesis protein